MGDLSFWKGQHLNDLFWAARSCSCRLGCHLYALLHAVKGHLLNSGRGKTTRLLFLVKSVAMPYS